MWATNPYLDGISDEPPTKTDPKQPAVNKAINIALAQHGLNLTQEVNPEIYLGQLECDKYKGNQYIDLNYTSFVGAFTVFDALAILRANPHLIVVNPSSGFLKWSNSPYVQTTCLRDYASLIYSADAFSALASGGATLALALGRPSTIFHGYGQNPVFHHSANNNVVVGSDGVARQLVAKYLSKRNAWRINRSIAR